MKKLLFSLLIVMSHSVIAADNSVYAWGPWSEGVKPAAGPAYVAPAPAPASEPQVELRESLALLREYNDIQPPPQIITGLSNINLTIPVERAPPTTPVAPPQLQQRKS